MTLRCGGRDVRIGRDDLADAFPTATPRLVVFLHGLCETDEAWLIRSDRFTPYGPRLERELGYTPLYVRYNTGLHISENGRKLERRLSELVAAWPVEVGEIALIGHSMGGLVSRSACYYGLESDWVTKVRHVFTLGTPHGGAPLEQVVHAASCALASLPETRSLAQALNRRSVGIKDLRHGYLLEEDWTGHDPDAFIRRAAREVPFLSTANHYFVCATLSRDSDAPVGRVIGDLLVLRASAWAHGGKGRRMRFPVENYRHVGGATHFDLLNHPAIYDQISKWLGGARGLPAPAAA
jgi:pimeloyl-ACP methyl ester carboxylesterase